MNSIISSTIELIKNDLQYKEYFFNNFTKMRNPKLWFLPLFKAKLLSFDNTLALPYNISLISYNELHKNKYFVELLTIWLEYFSQKNSDSMKAIWFLEKAITVDNSKIKIKCKNTFLKIISIEQNLNYIINEISTNRLDGLLLNDIETMYELFEKIINEQNFIQLSSNNYALSCVQDKLSKELIKSSKRTDFINLIISRLTSYLKNNPTDFIVLDTIEQVWPIFNYSNFILSWLRYIINENIIEDNNELCNKLENYLKHGRKKENHEICFILKIIGNIIKKTHNFGLIEIIKTHAKTLDILSNIKYSLYHEVLKPGIDTDYIFLPNFEDWLLKLKFSNKFINHVSNKDLIEKWSTQTKLELLKIFGEDGKAYVNLQKKYQSLVMPPVKQHEIKCSWESTNNYIKEIFNKSIEEIVAILNHEENLNENSDFHDLHLKEAIKKDYEQRPEKYNEKLEYIFKYLEDENAKSWIIDGLSESSHEIENNNYKKVIDTLLETQTDNLIYFLTILDLLWKLLINKKSLVQYECKIKSFLLMNQNKLDKELEDIDMSGGGLNSISGKCIEVLIQLHLQKSDTLNKFVDEIEDFKRFLQENNGCYLLGRYLFWLYKIPKFQSWFTELELNYKKIMFLGYFKYSAYISDELYKLSQELNLIKLLDNIFPYMNHIFYMFLNHDDKYLKDIINKNVSENSLEAIVVSIDTYEKQIFEKKAQPKILDIIRKILSFTKNPSGISNKFLYHADYISINKSKDIQLFEDLLSTQTLNSIAYITNAHNKFNELEEKGKYTDLLNILLKLAKNEKRNFYGYPLNYLNAILSKLKFIINEKYRDEYDQYIELIKILKQLNYPVEIKCG